jgi:hypothetical protein
MNGNLDDKRAAATIATSLSGYVIAGALAIIGAEAAIIVFLLDGKQISIFLWFFLLLTFLALFSSCYLGGFGIWKIHSDGFGGNWNIEVGGKFAWQFFLAMVGIFLLLISSLFAYDAEEKPKSQPAEVALQRLSEKLANLDSLPKIGDRLGNIERGINELRDCCSKKCISPESSSAQSHDGDPHRKQKPQEKQPLEK